MIQGAINALVTPAQDTLSLRQRGNPSDSAEKNAVESNASAENAVQGSENRPLVREDSFQALLNAQAENSNNNSALDSELTPEEEKEVQELKKIDAEVRAHEAAHKTAGGPVAGNVSFQTVTGPDGREYAVAGEVQIDSSPVPNNPEATIRKMELVIRAALAPAEPSPQDQAVAAQAQQIKLQAQQELAQQRQEELRENNRLADNNENNDLQNNESSVEERVTNEQNSSDDTDSSTETVSILFGN